MKKKIELEAKLENLDKALDFVNDELNRHNCPQNLQNDIDVATEEIFTNISNYAYEPEENDTDVSISISFDDKKILHIKFEDSGKPYNPLEQPEPDFNKPPEERQIGGLGIFMVKKLMDKIEYMRIENKNILVLTKKTDSPR